MQVKIDQKKRTKIRNEFYRRYPRGKRQEIYQKCDSKCVQCGSNEDLQVDHIISIGMGGGNELSNLQLLCRKCNMKKAGKEGIGRPKGDEQTKITFWVNKEALLKAREIHGKGLNEFHKKVNDWIIRLSKTKGNEPDS